MSTITKDLGAVSAYAYAVEKGYTGTEAEYAELMASYASVAQQAGESAQTATEKAQQASASAQGAAQAALNANTAMNYAKTAESYAQGAASEAQGYAQSAQQSATTATTKAQEASQSASESSQSASTAVQAKQDAQTAKTASETAQASAESARDDAESARDEAQQYAESIDPQKLIGAYPVDTATGAVASFSDGADNIPMKKVTVRIEPVQDLSHGDPSPDNICPITGWTGATVTRTGKNLIDYTSPNTHDLNISYSNGVYTASDGDMASTLRLKLQQRNASYANIVSAQITTTVITSPTTIYMTTIIQEGAYTLRFSNSGSTQEFTKCFDISHLKPGMEVTFSVNLIDMTIGAIKFKDCQLEFGSIASNYTPFTGSSTYPITFPTEAGTVYGGTLDVTTGSLVVDRANIASYNGETLPSEWISDRDVYSAGATPTTGAQVVYNLATPITLTLSPTEVHSLLGQNNVFANTGDSTVTYRADTTLYINRKIAEAVSALS